MTDAQITGRVITAPETIADLDGAWVFLAGPIKGAPDWQSTALSLLREQAPWLHIANPRRPALDEKTFDYYEQVKWERTYLRRAAKSGAILFWLANERTHDFDRAYAQTTRAELFDWKGPAGRGEARLAIGIDTAFSGTRYIRHCFSEDAKDVPFFDNLPQLCEAVVEMVQPARVQAVLHRWAVAHRIAEDNPRLLLENQDEATSKLCVARMEECAAAERAFFALKDSPHLPDEAHNFLRADADKGCSSCWLSSGPTPHAECAEKIARWFATQETLVALMVGHKPPPTVDVLLVLAGNYDQFTRERPRLERLANKVVYVTGPANILGHGEPRRDVRHVRIGTWWERSGSHEAVKMLAERGIREAFDLIPNE